MPITRKNDNVGKVLNASSFRRCWQKCSEHQVCVLSGPHLTYRHISPWGNRTEKYILTWHCSPFCRDVDYCNRYRRKSDRNSILPRKKLPKDSMVATRTLLRFCISDIFVHNFLREYQRQVSKLIIPGR